MLAPRKPLDLPGLGRWFDLSGPISNGMWEYGPPISRVWLEETTTHAGPRHESNFTFTLPHLAGTYLETPLHRFEGRKTLDELDMDELIRPAAVLKLPILEPLHAITAAELAQAAGGKPVPEAVLISTGWDSRWDTHEFVKQSPHFSAEAMDWLIAQNIRLLAADMPCFDHPVKGGDTLNAYFKTGGNILAPITGFRSIATRRVLLVMSPLAVRGVCGAPCRAFAAEWHGE